MSSGQSPRKASSVEPGLPKTRSTPKEPSTPRVASRTVKIPFRIHGLISWRAVLLETRSEGIVLRLGLDGDPAQIGELGDPGPGRRSGRSRIPSCRRTASAPRRAPVGPLTWQMPLSMRCATVSAPRDVPAEHGGREAALRYRWQRRTASSTPRARTTETTRTSAFLGVDAHAGHDAVEHRCRYHRVRPALHPQAWRRPCAIASSIERNDIAWRAPHRSSSR